MAIPLRTCVGCRKVVYPSLLGQADLLRIAILDGKAVVDARRRQPGRGAWVHRTPTCVRNAARGGLARSFRRAVDPAELLAIASEKS